MAAIEMSDAKNALVIRADEIEAEAEAVAGSETQQQWTPSTHELLIMLTLSVISFMVALDACIIVTSLTAIVTALQGTATQGFWIGTAYLLANAVTMPFIAAISDIFGRPLCLIAALCMFTIGSILCATAHHIGILLVGRSVQGVGGGGIMVLSLVIFTDIVPLRFRPKWYGTVLGAWALGNCVGPVVGGLIAQHTTWRWVFYLMFPFCLFGLVSVPYLLTLKPKSASLAEKLGRVDWLGGFLFMSSATAFLIAVSWGGSEFAWNSVQTIAPLTLGLVGLGGTIFWERGFASEPFLKPDLFWCLSPVCTFLCGALQGLLIYGQFYYIPFFLQTIKGFTPTQTGLALLPVLVTLVPGSIVTGALVTRYNKYLNAIWIGWVLVIIACGVNIAWSYNDSAAIWVPTLILLGFGHGSILNAQNFGTQAMCHAGDEGAAAAMYGFFRQFGSALGVGIGGSCFQNVMALKLRWVGLPGEIAQNAEAFVAELRAMPDGDLKTAILEAYRYGFEGVYAMFLGISVLAFCLSLLVKHFDMNKALNTTHILEETRVWRKS